MGSSHRQPDDAPERGADRDCSRDPGGHRHAQDRPRRRLRRVRRRRVVAVVGVAMMVVMGMAVGMGMRHDKMLYYNITQVHLTGRLRACRSPWTAPRPGRGTAGIRRPGTRRIW